MHEPECARKVFVARLPGKKKKIRFSIKNENMIFVFK
jgi:hypothetical protein